MSVRWSSRFAKVIAGAAMMFASGAFADSGQAPRAGSNALAAAPPTPVQVFESIERQCEVLRPRPLETMAIGKKDCRTSSIDCVSTVEVSDKIGKNNEPCTAEWTHSKMTVRQKRTPRLVWEIADQTSPPEQDSKYRFVPVGDHMGTPIGGIAMCPQSKNDESQDLARGGCVGRDCETYKWTAVNKRKRLRDDAQWPHDGASGARVVPAALHFAIVVYEVSSGKICHADDPVIINKGP